MIEFITLLIVLIIVLCIRVYRKTKVLAAKERDYIDEQRMSHNRKTCRIYDATKLILVLIAIFGAGYIFISVAIGETIGVRHLRNMKFWITTFGSMIIFLLTAVMMILRRCCK